MRAMVTRAVCVVFWVTAAGLGYFAVARGDSRLLLAAIAQSLLAVVLWFAMPPGATALQPPAFGTRGLRRALYASTILTALVATMRWPGPLDDSRGSDSAVVLFFSAVVIGPFLRAERRTRPSA